MASQLLVIVTLTHLDSPKVVGVYAFANAAFTPVILFTNLRVRQVYVVEGGGVEKLRGLRRSRNVAGTVGAIACILIAGFRLKDPALVSVALAVLAGKLVEGAGEIYLAVPQAAGDMRGIGLRHLSRALAGAIAFIALRLAGAPASLALAAASGTWLIAFLVWYRPLFDGGDDASLTPDRSESTWFNIRRLLPLGLAGLAVSLSSSVPRLTIADQLGLAALGRVAPLLLIYAALQFLTEVVVDGLLGPLASGLGWASRRTVLRGFFLLGMAGLMLAIALYLLGILVSPGLGVVLGDRYGSSDSDTFALLMGAAGLQVSASVGRAVLLARRQYRQRLWTDLAGLVAVLVGSAAFVPAHGAPGAALALAVWAAAQFFAAAMISTMTANPGGPR